MKTSEPRWWTKWEPLLKAYIYNTIFESMFLKYFFLLTAVMALSCRHTTPETQHGSLVIIHIQPFAGISHERVLLVTKQLNAVFPHFVINEEIPLPSFAYYPERGRYKADSLLEFLSARTPEDQITLGLTDRDISTTKGDTKDWGVMGLGYQPGNACVVSSFRLDQKDIDSQFYKVCIHELGHTEGLAHCTEKTCYMRDAEGHNTTNEEKEFCEKCRQKLIAKGWHF